MPRRLQELRLHLTTATGELSQSSAASPTVAELAAHLGVTEEEVLEGLESANAYCNRLARPRPDGDDAAPASPTPSGEDDEALEGVEYRESLKPLLAQLPAARAPDPHAAVLRRHDAGEIAAEVGISQMHVSRLLAKTLAQLRTGLLTEE